MNMKDNADLSCQELVELVTDYIEGSLSDQERARFDEHLTKCTGCRNYLAQMRLTIRSLGQLSEEAIPAQAREDLLGVFRNWKKAEPHA
jgi:anti-sigma factor RsiW